MSSSTSSKRTRRYSLTRSCSSSASSGRRNSSRSKEKYSVILTHRQFSPRRVHLVRTLGRGRPPRTEEGHRGTPSPRNVQEERLQDRTRPTNGHQPLARRGASRPIEHGSDASEPVAGVTRAPPRAERYVPAGTRAPLSRRDT